MKGVLTVNELEEAVEKAIKEDGLVFRDKEKSLKALKLYLVDGHSSSYAMNQTGIHRTKITKAGLIILNAWRKIMANGL